MSPTGDLDGHARRIEAEGYTVLTEVLEGPDLDGARDALDRVFEEERDVAGERGWANATYRVSYLLPAKDERFLALCGHPRVTALVERLLGPDHVVAACNGLSMTPGGEAQELHRDQEEGVDAVVYLNAVVALDDFTARNGATRLVPGSHRGPEPSAAALEAAAVTVEVAAGDAIVYDAGLWHAGSRNATSAPRRALHLFYGRLWARPHWDFPASLPADVVAGLDDEQRRRFGFGAAPPRFDVAARRVVPPR